MTNKNVNTIKILFVCHGNICRSPMAEFIMKDMVEKRRQATVFILRPRLPAARKSAIRFITERGINCASTVFPQKENGQCR